MKEEELLNIQKSIVEKLGEENAALISDDLGTLITKNSESVNRQTEMESRIKNLEEKNEKLVAANGSLLQQIPQTSKAVEREEEEKPKNFNFYDMFDKYGHFK